MHMLRDSYLSSKEFIDGVLEFDQQRRIDDKLITEANQKREDSIMFESYEDLMNKRELSDRIQNQYSDFSNKVKETLLSECLYKLYDEVMEFNYAYNENKTIGRNLINKFINENGVDRLLSSFKTKNILLSEYHRLVTKYHKQITEAVDKENPDSFSIDTTIKDNFFDDLNMVKPEDVILNIRTRVSDAVQEFIDSNTAEKMDIKEIIQNAQDKMNQAKMDEVKESYNIVAKRQITEMTNRPRNVFSTMVFNMAESTLRNDNLRQHYMKDNKLNMDKIVESCELMYTLLEMANTTEMTKFTPSTIKDILNSFKM